MAQEIGASPFGINGNSKKIEPKWLKRNDKRWWRGNKKEKIQKIIKNLVDRNISIINLNVNGLKTPVKRLRLSNGIKIKKS